MAERDQIIVVDNVFDESFRADLHTRMFEHPFDYGSSDRIDTAIRYINGVFTPEQVAELGIMQRLKGTPLERYADYEVDSGIINTDTVGIVHFQHTHVRKFVFLYYLDSDWSHDMGGETLFFDRNNEEMLFASPYVPNRGVFFDGNLSHTIRAPTRTTPRPRMTFGVFINKKEMFEKPACDSPQPWANVTYG